MAIERKEQSVGFLKRLEMDEKGGAGSGHFGHAGRPGKVGGSADEDGHIPRARGPQKLDRPMRVAGSSYTRRGKPKGKPKKGDFAREMLSSRKGAQGMLIALDSLRNETASSDHESVHESIANTIYNMMGGEKVGDMGMSRPIVEGGKLHTNFGGEKYDYSKGFKVAALNKLGFTKKARAFRKAYSSYVAKSEHSKVEITASAEDYSIDIYSKYKGDRVD